MAVALKTLTFHSARELASFCANGVGGVTAPAAQANIISITFDAASGKYTIFFT